MQTLNCPVCSAALHETTKNGITIDTCSRCRGIWLDRGELEKLIEGIKPEIREYESSRRHSYDDHDDDDRHRGQNYQGHGDNRAPRKRSKLEGFMDIFD